MDEDCLAGWVLEARIHFGSQLNHYVGVSVFVKHANLLNVARTSGLLLCVGIGSYIAYRLCLKLFNCQTLSALLSKLKADYFSNTHKTEDDVKLHAQFQHDFDAGESFPCSETASSAEDIVANGDTVSTHLSKSSDKTSQSADDNDNLASSDVYGSRNENDDLFNDNTVSSTDVKRFRRRSRNSAKVPSAIYKTNALSDLENRNFCSTESSSSDGSLTPPPVGKLLKHKESISQSRPCDDNVSLSSCPSSQALAWDLIFTPSSSDRLQMQDFEDAYLNECNRNLPLNLQQTSADDESSDALIRRLLASLNSMDEKSLLDSTRPLSPELSEISEDYSVGADNELGGETVMTFKRVEDDLTDLRCAMDNLGDDFDRYFDERRRDWILGTDYSKQMYRSVIVAPSTSGSCVDGSETDQSETSSHVTCKTVPFSTKRSSLKRFSSTKSLPNEIRAKRFRTHHSTKIDAGSYCTQISSDLHLSDCSSSYCNNKNEDIVKMEGGGDDFWGAGATTAALMAYSSSFVDSCISMDFKSSSVSSESCEHLHQSYIQQQQHFKPSLDVTPEDKDGDECSTSNSVRPDSLEWDETEDLLAVIENGDSFKSSLSRQNSCDNIVSLHGYLNCRFPNNLQTHQELRKLAKQKGLLHVRLISDVCDSLIQSFLVLSVYHKFTVFKCSSFLVVKDALNICLKRCPAALQNLAKTDDCLEELTSSLEILWNFHNEILTTNNNDTDELHFLSSSCTSAQLVQAVKIFMLLRVIEVYDQISLTRQTPHSFYNDLFQIATPKDIASHLSRRVSTEGLNELEIALLADTMGVSIELYRFTAESITRDCYPNPADHLTANCLQRLAAIAYFGSDEYMPIL